MEKSREKTKYRKKIENIKTTEENKRKGDEQKKKKKESRGYEEGSADERR